MSRAACLGWVMLLGLSVGACGDDGGDADDKAGAKVDAGNGAEDDDSKVETPRGDNLDTCDSNEPCCIDNPDYDFLACTTPQMDASVPPGLGDAGMGDDAGADAGN